MTSFEKRLQEEVEKSGIDVAKLRTFMWGGKDNEEYNRHIIDTVTSESSIKFRPHFYDLDRPSGFANNFRRINKINEMADEGKIPHVDMYNYGVFSTSINVLYPTSVHHGMFESIIKVLGSDEQMNMYWDDILNYRILG